MFLWPKEHDRARYRRHMRVWIYGFSVSFVLSGLFGFLLRHDEADWVPPAALAMLFFPLVLVGAYGLKLPRCLATFRL